VGLLKRPIELDWKKQNMSVHDLSKEELIELVELAIKKYPGFAKNVDEAVQISATKPPPKVNYADLLYDFRVSLKMLDGLRPSQQFSQVGRIREKIDPIIEQVGKSVNGNSPLEDVESAFKCLCDFAFVILETNGEIYKRLASGDCMENVDEGMVEVGRLMKEKGGPTDPSFKGMIRELKNDFEFHCEDVMETIWGSDEDSEGFNEDSEGADEDGDEGPSIPAKRARLE
jgi:hypothetical protein